jgi:hypothetical protein
VCDDQHSAQGILGDPIEVDCEQFVSGRQCDDQLAMTLRYRAGRDDQAAIRGAREGREGAFDLAGIAHVDRGQLDAERRCHGLDCAELAGRWLIGQGLQVELKQRPK